MTAVNTALLVDGAYLMKASPERFDYVRLLEALEEEYGPVRDRYYFNATPDSATDSQNAFHSWMKSVRPKGPHFRLKLYDLKKLHCKCSGCGNEFDRPMQKGVDVGLATFAIKLAAQNRYNKLLIAAGDGDFDDALAYVRDELGKEVHIVGFQGSVSTDLQSLADDVFFLDGLIDRIKKAA